MLVDLEMVLVSDELDTGFVCLEGLDCCAKETDFLELERVGVMIICVE